jgi:hypothetical protein
LQTPKSLLPGFDQFKTFVPINSQSMKIAHSSVQFLLKRHAIFVASESTDPTDE